MSDEVWSDNRGDGVNGGGEGWRVSEEWGQAPEVQSHQLRQLCGANTGVRRWGSRMSLQRREKDRDVETALPLLILNY